MAGPGAELLRWVGTVVPGGPVETVTGLRDGGPPWRLTLSSGTDVVLRVGSAAERELLAAEVAGLRAAAAGGLPVPVLLGARLDGGQPAVLTSFVRGSSRISPTPSPFRLRALGAVASRVHAVPVPADLPFRDRPINGVDFAARRRAAPARPLLAEAERVLSGLPAAVGATGLVHGDLWHGNTLWTDHELTALIDWDGAGVGQPGVDLGSLRATRRSATAGRPPRRCWPAGRQRRSGRRRTWPAGIWSRRWPLTRRWTGSSPPSAGRVVPIRIRRPCSSAGTPS